MNDCETCDWKAALDFVLPTPSCPVQTVPKAQNPQAMCVPAAQVHDHSAVGNITPPNPFSNPLHCVVSTAVLESQHTSLTKSRMSARGAYTKGKLAVELFIANQDFLPRFEVISLHWT